LEFGFFPAWDDEMIKLFGITAAAAAAAAVPRKLRLEILFFIFSDLGYAFRQFSDKGTYLRRKNKKFNLF
jgi:hypothetical protein